MPDPRDPEVFTQAEIEEQAAQEPEDPHTQREEIELDRTEATADD